MGTAESVAKSTVEKTTPGRRRPRSAPGVGAPAPSREQLRDLLEAALRDLDRDPRLGSLLHAKGMRVRFRITDLGLTLAVIPSDGESYLQWRFEEAPEWEPKLDLEMASEVANSYLQGKESLAIALARGRIRATGDARCALFYVPALRLLVDAYTREVRDRHPDLALD